MGIGGHGQGELSPEIAKLTKALAKDPKSKVFMQLAEEYLKAGLPKEAVPVLEEGLKHYPTFVTARVTLGRAYNQLGDTSKARAMLEEAVKMSPENLAAHRILAKIYLDRGALEKASKSCEMVLAANPKDEEFLALKASLGGAEPPLPAAVPMEEAGLKESAEPEEAIPSGQGSQGSDTGSDNGALERKIAALQSWLDKIQQRRG
jgi:tetratricopeptide (TPR) repeat protein